MVGYGEFDPLDLHCVGINEHASCAILLKKTAGRALLLGHAGKLDDVGFGGIWFDRLQRIPHTGFLADRDKGQTACEGAVKIAGPSTSWPVAGLPSTVLISRDSVRAIFWSGVRTRSRRKVESLIER